MRFHWRSNALLCVLMVLALIMAPQMSWPKGERPSAVVRSGNGVMRGIVKAATQAMLYTQIQGRVSQLPRKEGERIEKGETLVQIDCEKYRAELAAAIAEHQAKDKTFANNKELTKLNAVSTLELEISEAEAKTMQPDYFLVLPWHFKDGIVRREKAFLENGGKFIFPFPEIEIV